MDGPAGIYLQVAAIGLPWTLLHCGAMCGPLLLGLGAGQRAGGHRAGAALADLAAYQGGRALGYAAAGALAGAAGASVAAFRGGGAVLAGLVAASLVAAAVMHLLPGRAWSAAAPLARWAAPALRWRERRPGPAFALLGGVLSPLPCGIALWALALAAATGSALHGAGVMLALLGLTCLPLTAAVVAPTALRRARIGNRWLVPACLVLSAGTTLLMAWSAAADRACCHG